MATQTLPLPSPCFSTFSTSSSSRLSDYSDSGSSSDGLYTDGSYTSSSSSSSRRPLPRVPSTASLSSKRPLPSVPDSLSGRVRPLPLPLQPHRSDLPPQPKRSDSLLAATTHSIAPKLNLIFDFKSSSKSTPAVDFALDTPLNPLSPITFDVEESRTRIDREDKLALRLSAFGFVEVPESSAQRDDEDVVILEEEFPPTFKSKGPPSKRYSRRWVREKKGKRWVEDDYLTVLDSLRKL
ncbi:hypothetical protein BXZ70DRAFT_951207 [Cristinia sonorae]|uniref:Uncharacterized protein n=1 Tax=Cristinia sonorae TaxID=1940300 RepID=A0A8K0UHH4_9AGAR|nr:hypothetical protein BXZ70DRAFT_951207 [Cristinia sonorae]